MSRHRDIAMAGVLTALSLMPVVLGGLTGSFPLIALGILALVVVLPISYKLARYPPTRQVTLGELMHTLRSHRGSSLAGSRGMLICFSGIDGTGKTTLAEHVVDEFEALNVPATHVWARWRPFFSYPFMGLLYVTLGWRRKDYHRSAVLQRIWGYFLVVDHVLFFIRHIYPQLLRGRVVCIDRYVLDQLVEMKYDELYNERAAQLLVRLLPSPTETFLLDVSVDDALARKQDTQEMLDRLHIDADARSYLESRRDLFHEVSKSIDATVVDTSASLDETRELVAKRAMDAYFELP